MAPLREAPFVLRMKNGRVLNFGAGPSAMPLPVLEQAQHEFLNWEQTGVSILEISHRSRQFMKVVEETQENIRRLYGIPDDYEVLFIQGGGHMQFAMVPLNLAGEKPGAYAVNGIWSKKALAEAVKVGSARCAAECEGRVPTAEELDTQDSAYTYYCSNETVNGIQYQEVPRTDGLLVADMSSDFLSRPVPIDRFGLIFAGAQKNLGPAGLTVVIVRKDLLGKASPKVPTMLNYETYAKSSSLYNTPPVFSIYMSWLVTKWILREGGLKVMHDRAKTRSSLIYDHIDRSEGFYRNKINKADRSRMNVVFNLKSKELEERFVTEAQEQGLTSLKGHRLVGGIRASLYNAMPVDGAERLADFMSAFCERNA